MNGWIAGLVVAAVVVPVLIGLVRAGRGLGSDFTIRYRPGRGTTVSGRVAPGKLGAVASFFDHDLRPGRAVTVRGTWGPNRLPRLTISGDLSAAQKQRARNFLIDHLR